MLDVGNLKTKYHKHCINHSDCLEIMKTILFVLRVVSHLILVHRIKYFKMRIMTFLTGARLVYIGLVFGLINKIEM